MSAPAPCTSRRQEGDSLDGLAVLVRRVALRLAAPLLVTLDRAQVGDLDDDGLAERARVRGRVRIPVSRECEAAAACVAGA